MITGIHTDTIVLESQKCPEAASMFTDQHSKVAGWLEQCVLVRNCFLINLKVLTDIVEAT
jgi:hypothetical protein